MILSALILSGCAGLSERGLNSTEKMMWCTYPLSSKKIIGTCFMVAMKDRRSPGRYLPVVVTSTHTLEAADKDPLFIPLRLIGADGKLSFATIKIGGDKGKQPFYVTHPVLDVAAFPLPLPPDNGQALALRLLEEKNLLKGSFRAGENVSFLGFPEGLPGTPDLFPVLRGGRIASYDPRMFAARLFLINGDVYPGDSGAPVFTASRKGNPQLVGMVIQRIEIYEGERSPIALAVDVGIIRETLELLAIGQESMKGRLHRSLQ